jgi:hydroxymethylglutaryl-CoA lyase
LHAGLLDAGVDRVSMADTVGYANPAAVSRLFEKALKIAGDKFWCGHFHDTRGSHSPIVTRRSSWASIASTRLSPASAAAARARRQRQRVHRRPRVHAGLDGRGHRIDIDKLLALRAKVAGWLEGEPTHGAMWRAGLPRNFVPVAA